MAQEEQIATVNLDKLCLTQQDFKHLWQQVLNLFLLINSCNKSCFLFREIWQEVSSTTVKKAGESLSVEG